MTNGHDAVKYRGCAFEWGDRVLIVPPLSTRQMEELADKLDMIGSERGTTMKATREFISKCMIPLTAAALSRNYPNLSLDDVKDFVTVDLTGPLVGALLGNSEAPRVKVGEPFPAVLPGVKPSAPVAQVAKDNPGPNSTGPTSEDASPAPLDGPGISSLKM